MNKYDLVNDDEIVQEYKNQFLKHINKYLKDNFNFEISRSLFDQNTFVVSAATHVGLEDWTKYLVNILKKTDEIDNSFDEIEVQTYKSYENNLVTDITDIEKDKLLDEGYLEDVNSKYNKVWLIDDPEICKYVFITQWGNDEGEMYFWKQMEEKGFLAEFEKNGIKKGDILKIKSYYETEEDRIIMY